MATNAHPNDLTCCLCGHIYTNPVVLSSCNHSFDRHCILRHSHCPIEQCNAPVFCNALLPNHVLRNVLDHHNHLTNCTYELFLLDTSTSMWYSDIFFGLIGISRFQKAIEFLCEVFYQRWNCTTNRISLVTFDTDPIERFPFEIARQEHQEMLQALRPNGSHTSLFDGIKFCLEKFDKLNQIINHCAPQCLYILSDGGDNFSASGTQQHYIDYVREQSRKLNITGHIIQVGDTNLLRTKQLSDQIDYRFYHFNTQNASEYVHSFISTTNYDPRNVEQATGVLPNPCTAPLRPIENERKTGILA